MTEALLALLSATVLLLGSPGPAPLALAATSAAFGVRRSLPFLFGILAGLLVVIVGAALGLAALLAAHPVARTVAQVVGGLYIGYVAYKIATAPVTTAASATESTAPGFVDGFVLNILNPKAYAAFLALFSQFLLPLPDEGAALAATATVCLAVAVAVDVVWLCLGGVIGPVFRKPRQARVMRVTFAVLMVGAVLWAFAR